MAADLLGLFEANGLKAVKKTSGEWAAPCPACGGTDRCMIKPADHGGRGGYWCRQCGAYGDAIQFLRDFEGMSYGEACRHLGIEAARATSSLPRPPRPAAAQDPFLAAPSVPPAAQWTAKATAFVAWAHQHLLNNTAQLSWLVARGLPLEAVKRYRLGWNPGEKGKSCLIRPRSSWGLPPVETEPDAAGNPGKPKTTFWIPRGLVIPYFDPAATDGRVLRLRIRRPDADREQFGKDKKYYVIPGSNMDAMILGRDARAFVVVESELDALMLHHMAGDLVGAVSVMTANVRKIEAGVQTHTDWSGWNEQMGVDVTYLTAGHYKAIANPDQPLSDEARAYLQDGLDRIYDLFLNAVAAGRGVSREQALAMADGKIFLGRQALELGLVDRLESRADFINRIVQEVHMDLAKLKAEHPGVAAEHRAEIETGLKAGHEAALAAAVEGERTRVLGVVGVLVGEEQGGKIAAVVSSGVTAEQAKALGAALGADAAKPAAENPGESAAAKRALAAMEGAASKPLDQSGDPRAAAPDFDALVAAKMEKGLSKGKAMAEVIKENPKAHAAWVAQRTGREG